MGKPMRLAALRWLDGRRARFKLEDRLGGRYAEGVCELGKQMAVLREDGSTTSFSLTAERLLRLELL